MPYNKTNWINKIVEKPRTFTLQNNPDGTVTLMPAEGMVYEMGTPVNAVNMNKIEQGISDAHATLDSIKNLTDIILTTNNWVNDIAISGCYYYQIADATVTINTVIDVYFDLSTVAVKEALQDLEIVRVESFAGYYRIYAKNLATQNFTIDAIVKH